MRLSAIDNDLLMYNASNLLMVGENAVSSILALTAMVDETVWQAWATGRLRESPGVTHVGLHGFTHN